MKYNLIRRILTAAFCVTLAGSMTAAPALASVSTHSSKKAETEEDTSDTDEEKASETDEENTSETDEENTSETDGEDSGEDSKKKSKTVKKTDLEKATEKAKKKLEKKKRPVSVKVNGKTWYFTAKGKLRATQKGKSYYYKNGKKMSKADRMDFTTRLAAEKIVNRITKPSMSKKKKLSVCFRWVMKKYYGIHRKFMFQTGWPAIYAMDHFKNKNGDCHSDGAAFAYLAAACGYKKVYVCLDSKVYGNNNHGWAEVNGKVYDPLFAQSKSYSRNYAASYRTYGLRAIVKAPIPYASTESRKASEKRYRFSSKKSKKKKTAAKTKKSWKIKKWDKGKKHLLYKDGRYVTGTALYKGKLYVFNSKGKLDQKKTEKIRAAAKKGEDASVLLKLAGKPQKKSYSDSCVDEGQDGLFTYHTFRITTFKPADGSTEVVMSVE